MLSTRYLPDPGRATLPDLVAVAGSVARLRRVAADIAIEEGRCARVSEIADRLLDGQREAVEEPEEAFHDREVVIPLWR
jgi:hypothetical protein